MVGGLYNMRNFIKGHSVRTCSERLQNLVCVLTLTIPVLGNLKTRVENVEGQPQLCCEDQPSLD